MHTKYAFVLLSLLSVLGCDPGGNASSYYYLDEEQVTEQVVSDFWGGYSFLLAERIDYADSCTWERSSVPAVTSEIELDSCVYPREHISVAEVGYSRHWGHDQLSNTTDVVVFGGSSRQTYNGPALVQVSTISGNLQTSCGTTSWALEQRYFEDDAHLGLLERLASRLDQEAAAMPDDYELGTKEAVLTSSLSTSYPPDGSTNPCGEEPDQ